MSFSDAQFDLWLRQNNHKIILCDLDYVYAGSVVPPRNVALASNGASAVASSSDPSAGVSPAYVIDGERTGYLSGSINVWKDNTSATWPDTVDITFAASRTINKVIVYSVQDAFTTPVEPYDGQVGTLYALKDFLVQGWNGAAWVTLAAVTGNTLIKRVVRFATYSTTKIRISVSASQDNLWSRITEVEAWEADPAIGTVRLSTSPFNTEASDDPASTSYQAIIAALPNFERSLDADSLGGLIRYSLGDMIINNADGTASWLETLIIDGQEARFSLGGPAEEGWTVADYRPLFTALSLRVERPGRGKLALRLRAREFLLDQRVVGAMIGGSTSNANVPAPIVIGGVKQTQALLEVTASLRYRWCDATYYYGHPTGRPIQQARSNGVSLGPKPVATIFWAGDAGADKLTLSSGTFTSLFGFPVAVNDTLSATEGGGGTMPGGVVSGQQYWVVATDGATYVQLGNTRGGAVINITSAGAPVGGATLTWQGFRDNVDGTLDLAADPAGAVITLDVQNRDFFGQTGWLNDLIWWCYAIAAKLPPEKWLGMDVSSRLGINSMMGFTLTGSTNVTELLQRLCTAGLAFIGTTRLGGFTHGSIRPYDAPSVLTSKMTFIDDDVLGDVAVRRLDPKYKTVTAWAQLNYPPLSSVAAAVDADTAAKLMARGQLRVLFDEATGGYFIYIFEPGRYHATMTASPDLDLFTYDDDGSSEAAVDGYHRDREPHLEVLTFATLFRAYTLELGNLVTVNMPVACGHTVDTFWQVLGIGLPLTPKENVVDPQVQLTLLRRRVPRLVVYP